MKSTFPVCYVYESSTSQNQAPNEHDKTNATLVQFCLQSWLTNCGIWYLGLFLFDKTKIGLPAKVVVKLLTANFARNSLHP